MYKAALHITRKSWQRMCRWLCVTSLSITTHQESTHHSQSEMCDFTLCLEYLHESSMSYKAGCSRKRMHKSFMRSPSALLCRKHSTPQIHMMWMLSHYEGSCFWLFSSYSCMWSFTCEKVGLTWKEALRCKLWTSGWTLWLKGKSIKRLQKEDPGRAARIQFYHKV